VRRKRDRWLERIRGVELEFRAARRAADFLLAQAVSDPTILGNEVKWEHVRRMSERLDGTYIVRLFAEFETGLREFWPTARGTEPPGRTVDLVDGIAATRRIPDAIRLRTHEVRNYRNSLVHERDDPVDPVAVDVARGFLCRFFGHLPPDW